MVRRSLRLRFSLGKSNKDMNSECSSSVRSQNIGWRLAKSQELTVIGNKVESLSSPVESPFVSAGSKKIISRSEDNLLTPRKLDDSNNSISWTGPHQLRDVCDGGSPLSSYLYAGNCYSEPFLVTRKPPAMQKDIKSPVASCGGETQKEHSLCEDEECQAQDTVHKITKAFTVSGSDLSSLVACNKSLNYESPIFNSVCHIETETHIAGLENDSEGANKLYMPKVQRDCRNEILGSEYGSGGGKMCKLKPEKTCNKISESNNNRDGDNSENTSSKRSYKGVETNIDEICGVETSVKSGDNLPRNESAQIILKIVEDTDFICEGVQPKQDGNMDVLGFRSSTCSFNKSDCPVAGETSTKPISDNDALDRSRNKDGTSVRSQDFHSPPAPVRRSSRVSDHIQHFNRLCLNDRSVVQKVKSPIKLQRTPVRQSVRRIHSLLEGKRGDNTRLMEEMAVSPMVKSVSCDGTLSSELRLTGSSQRNFSTRSQENSASCEHIPEVYQGKNARLPKQSFVNSSTSLNPVKSVLEDLTNRNNSRSVCPKPDLFTNVPNNASRVISARHHTYSRGSPKNPIANVSFLPASRPLDL